MVSGHTLFLGYLRGEVLELPFDQHGWFATGDLGILDGNGLTFVGRSDNMFVSAGENIQPEEIESVIVGLSGARRVVVVPVVDDEFGRRPVAFMDPPPDDVGRLLATAESLLPRIKLPVAVYPWPDDAPPGHKHDRKWLLRRAAELSDTSSAKSTVPVKP
jgi:O-succinylbenzoic acid--CoA ligase